MKINNKSINRFHMKINSFTYQPLGIECNVFQPDRSIYPIYGKPLLKPKEMSLEAEFRSKLDISNFMAEVINTKELLIDIDDGYLYKSYFAGSSVPVDEYWQGWYRITLPFLVIQTKHEMIIEFNDLENFVDIKGNIEAECKYIILPLVDMNEFIIDGIKVRNLKANNKFVIDGVLKKVYTSTEQNRYFDCVFPKNKFPSLTPGVQKIKISDKRAKVKLIYSPIFA